MKQLTTPELRAGKLPGKQFANEPRSPLYLVLDGVTGKHNIGMMIRLADALRARKLFICRSGLSSLDGRTVMQTSRRLSRWVPHELCDDTAPVLAGLRATGVPIVSVELAHGSIDFREADYPAEMALVLGSESFGVSEETLAASDLTVHLPMMGMGNSLNVTTAAAVVLYHALAHMTPVGHRKQC